MALTPVFPLGQLNTEDEFSTGYAPVATEQRVQGDLPT